MAASIFMLGSAAAYAASSNGHSGGGSSGGKGTGGQLGNQGQTYNGGGETIDQQCPDILAGGDNSTSADRRYCRQHGY
jgi:hypothetical protein